MFLTIPITLSLLSTLATAIPNAADPLLDTAIDVDPKPPIKAVPFIADTTGASASDIAELEALRAARTPLDLAAATAHACRCYNVPRNGLYCGFCKNCRPGWDGNGWCTNGNVANGEVAWCNTGGGCEWFGARASCSRTKNPGPCNGAQS